MAGKFRGFAFGLEMPERRLVARVSRVERINDDPLGRTSYELDAIDERAVGLFAEHRSGFRGDVRPFALIRILTTHRRFAELLGEDPREGDWLAFLTLPTRAGRHHEDRILAWQAQLTETGYSDLSRGYVVGTTSIVRSDRPSPASLGAQAVQSTLITQVRSIGAFPAAAVASSTDIQKRLDGVVVEQIRVRDVGQASFATLLDANEVPALHFDAGWPVGFNWRGTPSQPPGALGQSAPIILSHWDWDHLHAYHKAPLLQERDWIAPAQELGPGAKRVVDALHSKGRLLGVASSVSLGWGELGVCLSSKGGLNHTGLALRVTLANGRNVLLVGDADYDAVPPALRAAPLHGLVVTHHGANFDGQVPPPASHLAHAIISCGQANVYRHPRKTAIMRHTSLKGAAWKIIRTDRVGRLPRGDRWLV